MADRAEPENPQGTTDNAHATVGPAHVFISYASPDAAVASALVEDLERHGIACWVAPRDVMPGDFYGDAIVHAIDAAKAAVLILSQHSAGSPHVLREVERASSKRHPVVSLRIDHAPLPAGLEYFLNTSQWLDASEGDPARAFPKLVEAVRRVLSGAPTTRSARPQLALFPHESGHGPTRRSVNRPLTIVLALIGVAFAGIAIHSFLTSKHAAQENTALSASPGASVAVPGSPAMSEKSIAVLPFVDMSEKKNQEYFSDGLSEELIDMLSKVADLRVPARTSSFYFKGKQTTIADVGKALGVAHVLEGSVRKSGKTLRITAQLIRTDNGYHVWSETYDRQLDDVFKVQDEIAGAVVAALKVTLLQGQLPHVPTSSNTEAYTLYLQGQAIGFTSTSPAEDKRAIDYLQRSLNLDPKFAPAWAAIANTLGSDFSTFGTGAYAEVRAQAHEAAERAIRLDPTLPYGHVAMGRILYQLDWSWDEADAELQRAISLEPANSEAHRLRAYVAITRGHFDKALELINRATAIDPLQPWNYIVAGFATYRAGDLPAAEAAYRRALDLNASNGKFHYLLGTVLLARGQPTAALEAMDQETDPGFHSVGRALALDALGRRVEADHELAMAEETFAGEKSSWIGMVYAARNDADRAFTWFDRAFGQHDDGLLWVKGDPLLVQVTHDPRYKALLSKMNLPE